MTEECPDYAKGVFLINASQFKCTKCNSQTHVVGEVAQILNDSKMFREVRVEFNYDPLALRYRDVALVRNEDEDLPKDANVLTVFSPLIKTDKRALRVAESYLAQMSLTPATKGDDVPHIRETLLNFDKPMNEVKRELEELHYRLYYSQTSKLPKS